MTKNNNLESLMDFFRSNWKDLPKSATLNQCTEIKDIRKFVNSHIKFLKGQSGNKTFLPYYERLAQLRAKIETDGKEKL